MTLTLPTASIIADRPAIAGQITARYYNGTFAQQVIQTSTTTPAPQGLWCSPGLYTFGGVGFDMRRPGLYRFFDEQTELFRHYIVWSNTDIDSFLSAFSHLHMDGNRDNGLTIEALQSAVRSQRVAMQCGVIAGHMVALCGQYAPVVPARKVQMTTAGSLIAGDNGHVVFEEKSKGRWRLWDITNGVYFTNGVGSHLGLDAIVEAGMQNCKMVRFTPKSNSANAISTLQGVTFDYGLFNEFKMSTDGDVKAWIDRIYQIPSIQRGGIWYAYMPTGTEARAAYVQSLGFTVIPKTQWQSFYAQS
jgi:hypothetical protein